jgi:hypothetical protein
VLTKMAERATESKESFTAMMDKYSDIAAFLAECDRIGVVDETAQFPSVRGPELARRLGHVHVSCVPRETETRATTLFHEVRQTLERLCDEPGNNEARGRLVLLAPEFWTDKELELIERGVPPPPPRVRPQGMGKKLVRMGTMRTTDLPGGIMLEITSTHVCMKLAGMESDVRRKKKPEMLFDLSFEKIGLILEQISRLTTLQSLLEQTTVKLASVPTDEHRSLIERARGADTSSLMLDVLVANDGFLLLVFMAVFVTAAPLGLEWDDAGHTVSNSDSKTQFVGFASLALHCTSSQVCNVIDAALELAPTLICGNEVKSDIFETHSNMPGLQLALSTVAFYLAMQQVSTDFAEIAGNTPHSLRLLPLALLSRLPIFPPEHNSPPSRLSFATSTRGKR